MFLIYTLKQKTLSTKLEIFRSSN